MNVFRNIYIYIFFFSELKFVFLCLSYLFIFSVHSEDSKNQPSSELNSSDSRAEDHVESSSRPLYALFVLPVLILTIGICVGYIRHFILYRVRNLIRMTDHYMLSTDDEDIDQTPVKVLDMQDNLSTFDYDSNDELAWDDSIERNAQDIVNEIEENKDGSNSSLIIDVNVEDYLKLFPKIPGEIHSTPKSTKNTKEASALGIDQNRFVPSPHHFPSFNIPLSDSSDENVDEDESKKIQSDNSKECTIEMEMKELSTTRSGKRYK